MPVVKQKASPRRTQQERRETTRRLLIESTIDSICELGFPSATLDIITRRAGVTRGSVQHHFRTRDDLLLAIVEELNTKLKALSDATLFASGSIERRLRWICEQLWEIISSRHFVAALQIQLGTVTDPKLSPRVVKIMIQIEEDLDNRWIELFADDEILPARIKAVRHVVQAALRGLATKQIYRQRQDNSKQEREVLVSMSLHVLRSQRIKVTS
jgi:AcrR family transcriptional regulator